MKIPYTITVFLFLSFCGYAQSQKPIKSNKSTTPSKPSQVKPPVNTSREDLKKMKEDSIKKAQDIVIEKQRLEKLRQEQEAIRRAEEEKRRLEEKERFEREERERRQKEAAIRLERENREKFGLGFTLGRTYSTLTTSEIGSINKVQLPAFNFGLLVNIPIFKQASIVPEIIYITKGLMYKYESDYEQFRMNYANVPINIKLGLFVRPNYKVFLMMGGYGGYWFSSKVNSYISNEKSSIKYNFDTDLTDGYKDNKIDYGVIAGIGSEMKIFKNRCIIEGRYMYGLSSISKFENKPESYVTPYNRSLGVFLGFTIN